MLIFEQGAECNGEHAVPMSTRGAVQAEAVGREGACSEDSSMAEAG